MNDDAKRLREAVRYGEAMIALQEHGSMGWGFWRGWRALALVELEWLLRNEPPSPAEPTNVRRLRDWQ